jgi:hypothetical protein
MHLSALAVLLQAAGAFAALTWSLSRNPNPSQDEIDAYNRIETSMNAAVGRYNQLAPDASKTITVPTADGSFNGNIRFGSNRSYMNERTALHEISHTLGVGTTWSFDSRCASGDWPNALPVLRSFDGPDAVINCGGSHFWPYGLNYDDEWSETNAVRHCQIVNAMVRDGLY